MLLDELGTLENEMWCRRHDLAYAICPDDDMNCPGVNTKAPSAYHLEVCPRKFTNNYAQSLTERSLTDFNQLIRRYKAGHDGMVNQSRCAQFQSEDMKHEECFR